MSSRWDERWYAPSKPRAVEGGLKARSTRGAIGESWWSRRFLDVLESFAMGGRLTRGRAYARKGQVISLEVEPGAVRASVQGSQRKPYAVVIELPEFSEQVWEQAEIALAEQALPSAKLLAGEVPPELEQIFADAGAPLFPESARELEQYCSCPDFGVPCKHLAATFYLLAEAFDADPFLILRWRGRDREPLLARVSALRSGDESGSEPAAAVSPAPATGVGLALAGLSVDDLAVEPDRFWLPPPPLPSRPAVLDVEPAMLLRQLPVPPAGLGGETLLDRLRPAYALLPGSADE